MITPWLQFRAYLKLLCYYYNSIGLNANPQCNINRYNVVVSPHPQLLGVGMNIHPSANISLSVHILPVRPIPL